MGDIAELPLWRVAWLLTRLRARRIWRTRPETYALAGLVCLIAALNLLWLHLDTRPPAFDMGGHLSSSLAYRRELQAGSITGFLDLYRYYPPFVYWVANAFYVVLGVGTATAVLSNVVFIATLAFSTYALGRRLWNRGVGITAAVFVLATPMMVTQFKEYQTDAPLTAVTALALYLLVRADAFAQRRYSVFLGVAFGIGLLTKWTFALAFALPVLFALVVAAGNAIRDRALVRVVNVALAAAAAAVVALPWYGPNITTLLPDVRTNTLNTRIYAEYRDPPLVSLDSVTFYLEKLLAPQLYLIPAVMLAVGVAISLARADARRANVYPLLLLAGTYASLTLLAHKDTRYTLPLLPAAALLACFWLTFLPTRARNPAALAVGAYCIAAFAAISFGLPGLPSHLALGHGSSKVTVFAEQGYIIGPPKHEQWYQERIFQTIHDSAQQGRIWWSGADYIWFNSSAMYYFSELYDVPVASSRRDARYAVLRSRRPPDRLDGFALLAARRLPDGSFLTVWERNSA